MIQDNDLITVRNRKLGSVGYTLDNNFHRNFEPGESKKVPFGELKSLQYAPGGEKILNSYLIIEDKEALELLNMKVEPEYFYKEDDIRKILFANDNIDAFADFLDFAPSGAIDIAKDIAIKEEIPDVRKREMLSEKTGFNINNAIMINKIMNEDDSEEKETAPTRRVAIEDAKDAKENESQTPTRRTAAPTYNVIKKVDK